MYLYTLFWQLHGVFSDSFNTWKTVIGKFNQYNYIYLITLCERMTELYWNVIRAFNFKLLIEWTTFDL